MNKRMEKKVQDQGKRFNRVQLKREYAILINEYAFEKRVNGELIKDIKRLEDVCVEQLNDKECAMSKLKEFNSNITSALKDKTQEVVGLNKEIDELEHELNLTNKKYQQAKGIVGAMEKSLKEKEVHMRALGKQNRFLKDELEKFNRPWYKRVFKK